MRSQNYQDMKASFEALSPTQMARVALVNGIFPWIEPNHDVRIKYLNLLKEFTDISERRLDEIFHLMEIAASDEPTKSKSSEIVVPLEDIEYSAKTWKSLDYNLLKKEGVVLEFDVNTKGLPALVSKLDGIAQKDIRHKVIELSKKIERPGVDYLKHIPPRQKLMLNSRDVVMRFAQQNGIIVPETYKERGGPPPVSMYDALRNAHFTFRSAMEATDFVIRNAKYIPRDIAVLVVKHLNGDETRYRHHDFVEAAELFMYTQEHNIPIVEKLGDKLEPHGEKYVLNVYTAPSMSRPRKTHPVELSYLPDFKNPNYKTLYWMKTRGLSGCEWGQNLRNFEFGKGETDHTAWTMETHCCLLALAIQVAQKVKVNKNPQNISPIPTVRFSRYIDVLRYQLIQGPKEKDYVNETGIEILANEFWKKNGISNMYFPKQKVGTKLLQNFY